MPSEPQCLCTVSSDYFFSLNQESKHKFFYGEEPYSLKNGDLSKSESFFPDFQ